MLPLVKSPDRTVLLGNQMDGDVLAHGVPFHGRRVLVLQACMRTMVLRVGKVKYICTVTVYVHVALDCPNSIFISVLPCRPQYLFTDTKNDYLWNTFDFCKSVQGFSVPFKPTDLLLHSKRPNLVLGYDSSHPNKQVGLKR